MEGAKSIYKFLFIFLGGLGASGFSQSTTPEKIFPNPFLMDRTYTIKSIDGVKPDKRNAGYTDRPEDIFIQFSVKGEKGIDIPHIPGDRFYYQIRRNQEVYRVTADTRYRGDGYFSQLRMPKVASEGSYDFLITVMDFGVMDFDSEKNKVSKTYRNFFRYRKKKADVLFLIDNSGSMNRNDPQRLRYRAIYHVLRNANFASKIDELAVISFSENSQVVFPFGKVSAFLKDQTHLGGRGHTDFSKPFLLAEKLIRGNIRKDQDHKAVIFLTDGVANFPYADEHLLLRNLGIPVYTVGLSGNNQFREYQPEFLRRVAGDTRGDFFEAGPEVIEEVFKKFIDLSTSATREFSVIPLKKKYAYNELLHIDYRSAPVYEEELSFKAYYQDAQVSLEAEVYQKQPGRISLYPPSGSEKTISRGKIQTVFRWRKKILFDETSSVEIGGEPEVGAGLIFFRQIDFLNYDIRYFPVKNYSQEDLFVDILSPTNSSPILTFKEIPFLLAPGEERSQVIVFHPLSGEKSEKNLVIDMVFQTSKGDYLNQINFDYLSHVKERSSSPPTPALSRTTTDRIFFLFLLGISIFFIFFILLKVIRKKTGIPSTSDD